MLRLFAGNGRNSDLVGYIKVSGNQVIVAEVGEAKSWKVSGQEWMDVKGGTRDERWWGRALQPLQSFPCQ